MLPRLCNNPLFKNFIFNRGIFHGKRGCFPGVCAAGAGASHAVWQLPVHKGHRNVHLPSGTSGTLPAFSGIFFMYIFLVRDPGKQVQCAGSAGEQKTNT